jgi:excisionase family DNA binding protein
MDQLFLTPDEVGELLRISTDDVFNLIESGALSALQIGDHWRITQESLTVFVSEGLRSQNTKALNRAIQDPTTCARTLKESPDLADSIMREDFQEGTVGDFLQKSLTTSEGVSSGTVTVLHPRKS